MGHRRIAAFDFDGTISTRDTLLPFLAGACGRRAFARAASRAGWRAARIRLGDGGPSAEVHHRDASKAHLLGELLIGRTASWLAGAGRDYARDVLPDQLRPEMVDQIRWHGDNGHELVLVSASLDAYLSPFAAGHGFHQVIAVVMEADGAGILTGAMARPNVRGPEKAVRLREWLAGDEPAFMWAYGNSSGDSELLEMADQAVWVGRRRRTSVSDPGPRAPNATMGPRR